MFPLSSQKVSHSLSPVGFSLFGNQLEETGMTRIEREGRVYVNPLDLSCVISSLQGQLAHTVACSKNKDVMGLQNKLLYYPQSNLWEKFTQKKKKNLKD